ncbi:MAG: SDR family oxidoreductase [Alphaproteobacteria bacterium]|nr:SDR family oxidoreductase [Alphaproteobacteria bacterium]
MDLKGKVAIVTGGGTGLGAEACRILAGKSCRVIVNYAHSAAEAEAVAKEIGGRAVKADVADDAQCRALAKAALDAHGRVDFLIQSAGTTKFVATENLDGITAEDFQRIYAVNVIGAFQMIRAVAPAMKRQGKGSVVNVSSVAGLRGGGSSIAYACSKGALNTMTMAMARALAPEIRVNALAPGFFESRWLQNGLGPERYAMVKQAIADTTPSGKTASARDVAEMAVWLATEAEFVNGHILPGDGGHGLNVAGLMRPRN